jgi:putative oxidoreductase
LLVLFLVPVTVTMHNFWAVKDQMIAQVQKVMFMKDLSMLGGALLIPYLGASTLDPGPLLRARSVSVQGEQGVIS